MVIKFLSRVGMVTSIALKSALYQLLMSKYYIHFKPWFSQAMALTG